MQKFVRVGIVILTIVVFYSSASGDCVRGPFGFRTSDCDYNDAVAQQQYEREQQRMLQRMTPRQREEYNRMLDERQQKEADDYDPNSDNHEIFPSIDD